MAANIATTSANSTGLSFVRRAGSAQPWWGIGHEVTGNSIAEWLKATGMDHSLALKPGYTINETALQAALAKNLPLTDAILRALLVEIGDINVVQRGDNGANICSTGKQTHILQHADVFAAIEPFIVADRADIDTAMILDSGRKVVVTAALRDGIRELRKGDAVQRFIVLAHGHDGTLAINYGLSLIRIVCQNTLSMSLADKASKYFKFRHSKDANANLQQIAQFLAKADDVFTETEKAMSALYTRKAITSAQFEQYMKDVFKITENKETGKLSTRSQNVLDSLMLEYNRQRGASAMEAIAELTKEHDQAERLKAESAARQQEEQGAALLDAVIGNTVAGNGVNDVKELMQDAERRIASPDAAITGGFSWGDAYNVATNRLRDMGHTPETRAASNLFGANRKTNDNAFALAMDMSGLKSA